MALITKSAAVNIDAESAQKAPQLAGDLYAGEDLDAAAPCYVKGSDGKVYMSNGTANTEPSKTDGFTPMAYVAGQAVTLYGPGTKFEYATGMTPGTDLYAGTTKGRLDTSATTGGTVAIARVITARYIQVRAYK